ncbi:MAG: hypothetical protein JNL68_15985 [Burkholderiales bacterium]|nr:hypothetical protein [Burkholderiales bacterium]
MSFETFDELKIEEIKRQLAKYVAEGRIDHKVIELLVTGRSCVPLECELLDYKQKLEEDRLAQARAIIQIVSLFNTFGGYLLFGVAERHSETEWPCPCST